LLARLLVAPPWRDALRLPPSPLQVVLPTGLPTIEPQGGQHVNTLNCRLSGLYMSISDIYLGFIPSMEKPGRMNKSS
jgi:hypothetical protein